MATEKKTATKAAAKTETVKAEKKTATKTATKAAKAETKVETKAETKTETAAKKPAAKKTTTKKTTTKTQLFIEFGGVQVSADEIVENILKVNGKAPKNLTVYVKPEESKAYFVADGEEKDIDVYFV